MGFCGIYLRSVFAASAQAYNLKIGFENYASQIIHDDVIKWKHFPGHWPFVRGIHRSPVNSLHKGQWRGALMFSLIYARITGWVKTGEAGHLRCHFAHYDVIVMRHISQEASRGSPAYHHGQNMKYLLWAGHWFNIKMSFYQYRESYCGDKAVIRSSYRHNGISYTGKTSLYWIRAPDVINTSSQISELRQCEYKKLCFI